MTPLEVLFVGGTGVISSACAHRAATAGLDLTVLSRGTSSPRPLPPGVSVLHADIRDPASVAAVLGGRRFDVVADFVAFTPSHVKVDLELFAGRTAQYVFVSSASAYQKPPSRLPVVESTPLRNPFWSYAQDKIACEDLLVRAYREDGFPATIVRPSHTYDRTMVPVPGRWTVVDRMRRGRPVVVHGDGTSLWTLTHSRDFAHAFVGLLGHPQALGDSFHITSDEVLTWNQVYETLAAAAGARAHLVHLASERIAALDPARGPSLLGDKAHSMVFDNSKVKALVPDFVATTRFATGAREIVDWYDADPTRRTVDGAGNATVDAMVAAAGWTGTVL